MTASDCWQRPEGAVIRRERAGSQASAVYPVRVKMVGGGEAVSRVGE
jgi:hypothetical protein